MTKGAWSCVWSSVEAVIDDRWEPVADHAEESRRISENWRGLFLALARGRVSALETLYDEAAHTLYGLALWRTGSAEDAADVVQDVFVRVAEQGSRLAKVKNPRAWLFTVTRRAAIDLTRRRKRRQAESLQDFAYLTSIEDDPNRSVDATRASALLAGLPAAQRDVVYLRHFAWCSFAEIGKIVGVPKFTAASRYRSGIARLRSLMEGK